MSTFKRRQASRQIRAQHPCDNELSTSTNTKFPSKSTVQGSKPCCLLSPRACLISRMPCEFRPQVWRSRAWRRWVHATASAREVLARLAFCRKMLWRNTSRCMPDFGKALQMDRTPAPVIRHPTSSSSRIHRQPGSARASTAAPVSCRGCPESFKCFTKGALSSAAQRGTSSRFVILPSTSNISRPRDRPSNAPPLGVSE
mmetsp:Transcript_28176/g.61270  ORF Transcript_28176/g.61270 Transcript_28176/m.61270 type:complete len:200 (-) Transcript_28176:439-1038(-)